VKVSILIPAYNAAEFIAETIECAINQSWQEKEIIIVDDGSSDNTYEIAKQFESDLVKVYRQDNKGASAARNYAFSKSNGEMIQYLDADDLLSPNKIEEQIKIYLNQSVSDSIITCNFLYFTDNIVTGLEFPRCRLITTDYAPGYELLIDIFDYLIGTQTSIWLVPRGLIEKSGGWNEQLSLNDDGEFFFRIISMCKIIYYCANAVVYYRTPNDGLSIRRDIQASKSQLLSTRIMRDIVLSYSKSKRARQACSKFYFQFYQKFDDDGNFDKSAEMDMMELGFHVDSFNKTKKHKIIRDFLKKIYKFIFK
jgi:glycosyltransferase involved in cell wall biosynthesis